MGEKKNIDGKKDSTFLNPSAGVRGTTGTQWTGINPQFHGLSTE